MGTVLRALTRGKYTLLAIVGALTLTLTSTALAGNGVGGVFNLGVINTVDAVTTLTGTLGAPLLRIDNNSLKPSASALELQVENGTPPMTVNSTAKVNNLNADQLDGRSVRDLSHVAIMQSTAQTVLPKNTTPDSATGPLVTHGHVLTINAPTGGYVRLNGNVTVLSVDSGCTDGCQFAAYIRHLNSGDLSLPSKGEVLDTYGNVGVDRLVTVRAGINQFDIQLQRYTGDGELRGDNVTLTAEYTPYE
jgi:hypothetical protein